MSLVEPFEVCKGGESARKKEGVIGSLVKFNLSSQSFKYPGGMLVYKLVCYTWQVLKLHRNFTVINGPNRFGIKQLCKMFNEPIILVAPKAANILLCSSVISAPNCAPH